MSQSERPELLKMWKYIKLELDERDKEIAKMKREIDRMRKEMIEIKKHVIDLEEFHDVLVSR